MDHSTHVLGGMDHGHGHGDTDTGDMCSMNMIFTWDYNNLCVIFKWWHVRSTFDLFITLIAIALFASGYEYIRMRMRLLDSASVNSIGNASDQKIRKALGYAFQVGYSYLLMLVFMTYNGWAMLAVCVGAFAGFYLWGAQSDRQMSCH